MKVSFFNGLKDWKRIDKSEAEEALRESEEALKEAYVKTGRSKEIAEQLRILRERNHFREQLQAVFMGVVEEPKK